MITKEKAINWARTVDIKFVAIMAWILDVLSCLYMVRWWQAKDLGNRLMSMSMQINGVRPEDVPYELQDEFMGMARLLFAALLFALVITNTVFYTGYAFKKKWAIPYVTGYLITAAIIGVTFLFEGFPVGGAWELINIIGIPAYFVLGFVAWVFKKDFSLVVGSPAQ